MNSQAHAAEHTNTNGSLINRAQGGVRRPMTVKEAADYLRVSPKTVRDLCRRKLIRYSKSLRKWLLSGTDVEKFIDKTC